MIPTTSSTAIPQVPRCSSARARVAAGLTRVALRPVTDVLPVNRAGLWFSRRLVATSMGLLGPVVEGTTTTRVDKGPVRGEWVCAPGVERSGRVILYLHGSAYVICSARTHRGLASSLSKATGLAVFTVDYRLAPEYAFPAAADDIESAYRWLLAAGHAAEDIVVAGDSAGGHLAVDLLIENDRSRMPQPGAMVLFSPLIDLRFELASAQERGRKDPMISAAAARKMVEMYTGDHPADLPRLRLQLPRIDRLPPTLIQVGGAEMLVADARYLHNMIRQSGGSSTLEIWPDQMHVFQALPRLVPEATQALRRAATFAAQQPEHRDEAVRERRKT